MDIRTILARSKGSFNRARVSKKVQKDRSTLLAFGAFLLIAALSCAVIYYTGGSLY